MDVQVVRAMPLLDDGNIAPQPPIVLRNAQEQNGIAKEADIDVDRNVLPEQAVLGDN